MSETDIRADVADGETMFRARFGMSPKKFLEARTITRDSPEYDPAGSYIPLGDRLVRFYSDCPRCSSVQTGVTPDCTPPTDRDLIIALLDAVMALSNRVFPEDLMQVRVQPSDPQALMVSYLFPTMTSWVPRAVVSAPLSEA